MSYNYDSHVDFWALGSKSDPTAQDMSQPNSVIALLKALGGANKRNTIAFQNLAVVSNTNVYTFDATKKANATSVVFSVEGSNVRIMTGSATPTASQGILISANDKVELTSISEIENFKVIGTTSGATAYLNIEYKGE